MSEMIGGYEVKEPLSNKNAGFSKWGFGEKDGKTWFLKEFLSPVYPVNRGEMTEKSMQRKLTQCHEYEIDKIRLFSQLGRASDGNLLRIHEFFRYGSKFLYENLVSSVIFFPCDKPNLTLTTYDYLFDFPLFGGGGFNSKIGIVNIYGDENIFLQVPRGNRIVLSLFRLCPPEFLIKKRNLESNEFNKFRPCVLDNRFCLCHNSASF